MVGDRKTVPTGICGTSEINASKTSLLLIWDDGFDVLTAILCTPELVIEQGRKQRMAATNRNRVSSLFTS